MKKKVPNPGSKEALALGCSCPILDNSHGLGFPWEGNITSFWVSENCPLHGKQEEDDADV